MRYRVILLIAAAGATLAACKDSVDISSSLRLSLYGAPGSSTYAGILRSACTHAQGAAGTSNDMYQAEALFADTNGLVANVSGVQLNGTSLVGGSGRGYQSRALQPTNSFHTWSVSGLGSVATFSDSVFSPAKLSITSPTYAKTDSVSMSSGFTITYSDPGTDSIFVNISYEAALSHSFDPTIYAGDTSVSYNAVVGKTGSITVSPSWLTRFPTKGILSINLTARNVRVVTADARQYYLASYAIAESKSYIKP